MRHTQRRWSTPPKSTVCSFCCREPCATSQGSCTTSSQRTHRQAERSLPQPALVWWPPESSFRASEALPPSPTRNENKSETKLVRLFSPTCLFVAAMPHGEWSGGGRGESVRLMAAASATSLQSAKRELPCAFLCHVGARRLPPSPPSLTHSLSLSLLSMRCCLIVRCVSEGPKANYQTLPASSWISSKELIDRWERRKKRMWKETTTGLHTHSGSALTGLFASVVFGVRLW